MANVIIGILYGFIIIIAVVILFFYNKIIELKSRADISWFNLYEQLKIWDTLNQKLVDIMCEAMDCEEEKMIQLSEARVTFMNALSSQETLYSIREMNRVFKELMIKAEDCLEANDNQVFANIKGQLKEVEERMAAIQQQYNKQVLLYNNFIVKFPNNMVAFILGIKKLFQLELALGKNNEKFHTNI